jgi:hypothetical protein
LAVNPINNSCVMGICSGVGNALSFTKFSDSNIGFK